MPGTQTSYLCDLGTGVGKDNEIRRVALAKRIGSIGCTRLFVVTNVLGADCLGNPFTKAH
jgi:hypothetical protein